MAYHQIEISFPLLAPEVLAHWRQIPAAVASDCMNRTQVMVSPIKPIFWARGYAARRARS